MNGWLWRWVLFASLTLMGGTQALAEGESCEGSPAEAVAVLPVPLDQWAAIYCTRYGHVIAAKEGLIWTRPGAYDPVFIPSQMVRRFPKELGNESYFRSIEFAKVDEEASKPAVSVFSELFPGDPPPKAVFRLDAYSNSGRSLHAFLLDDGDATPWGIFCRDGECDPASIFMILDMTNERPNQSDRDLR